MQYIIIQVWLNEFSVKPDIFYLFDSKGEYICVLDDIQKINAYIAENAEYYNFDLKYEVCKKIR